MESFMVSAPGKVIVYGEHAVVHGKAAMAAAISLRSYLMVTYPPPPHRLVTLEFSDIHLNHAWDIDSLPWNVLKSSPTEKVTALDPAFVSALEPHLAKVSPDLPENARKQHQGAAFLFLYLYLSLGKQAWPGSRYTMRSTLPIGAGLGSSASISVCLSAALLFQLQSLKHPQPEQTSFKAQEQIDLVNKWAYVGEMCLHGTPSGIDNTVASAGKAVLFRRNPSGPPTVTPIRKFPELPLLLVDTKQSRSTAIEVAKVTALKQDHPEVTDTILDAIDQITLSAHALISSPDFNKDDTRSLTRLGELNRVNHGLLVALGVSHPKLERIRAMVDHEGYGFSKLTGAGGGGCSITLLKPGVGKEDLNALEQRLEGEGFKKYETTLGGDGVGILRNKEAAVLPTHDSFIGLEGQKSIEDALGYLDWEFWRP